MPRKPRSRARYAYTRCRALGHAWDSTMLVPPDDYPELLYGRTAALANLVLELTCLRCDALRLDLLARGGDLVSRRYRYAEGYRYTEEDHLLTRQEWREQLVSNLSSRSRAS